MWQKTGGVHRPLSSPGNFQISSQLTDEASPGFGRIEALTSLVIL